MTVEISIIMSVYNTEKYLNECLDSIIAQTFQNWECICVDDGSTDGAGRILDDYAKKDQRFIAIHLEHSNAGHCRNVGMRKAQGKYLSFLDSDDVFASKMLEIFHEAAVVSNADIVVSCMYNKFVDGEAVPECSNKWDRSISEIWDNPAVNNNIFFRISGAAWNKLFKADFIFSHNIEFQEQRSTNDTRFVFVAACLAKRIVRIRENLMAYRIHRDSLQRTMCKQSDSSYKMLISFYEEMIRCGIFPTNRKLLSSFKLFSVIFCMRSLDILYGTEGCEQAYDCFKKIVADLDLYEVLNNPVPLEVAEALDLIKRDGSILEFSKMQNTQARRYIKKHVQYNPMAFVELTESRPSQYLPFSHRLGKWLTYIPRKIYLEYVAYCGRRDFARKCRQPIGQ